MWQKMKINILKNIQKQKSANFLTSRHNYWNDMTSVALQPIGCLKIDVIWGGHYYFQEIVGSHFEMNSYV